MKTRHVILAGSVVVVLSTGLSIGSSLQKSYPENAVTESRYPDLYPDYTGVSVPSNMAPLNFKLAAVYDKSYVKVTNRDQSRQMECFGSHKVQFDMADWHNLLQACAGDSLWIEVSARSKQLWTTWKKFAIYISKDTIDPYMVYRLIEPGYEKWHIVGIYQRNLETFHEKPVIENKLTGYNCVNCHSFCNGNPDRMMFHMRADNGGTYIVSDGEIEKLKTKTDQTVSNLTYPYWHPSGRYIASSVNTIRQRWRYSMPNRMWWCMMFPKKRFYRSRRLLPRMPTRPSPHSRPMASGSISVRPLP